MSLVRQIRESLPVRGGPRPLSRDQLCAPGCWAATSRSGAPAHRGLLAEPPDSFACSVVIPHCDTPDLLRLCLAWLELQQPAPYCMVVDTGSRSDRLDAVLACRGPRVEVHQVAGHGYQETTQHVAAALDLALSVCRTEWLLLLHSDCLLRPGGLAALLAAAEPGPDGPRWPAVGYGVDPRPPGRPWAAGALSHACTLLHVPTADRLGLSFATRRHRAAGGVDPETGLAACLDRAGLEPRCLGPDWQDGPGPVQDAVRVHLRAATSSWLGRPRALPGWLSEALAASVAALDAAGGSLPPDVAERLCGPTAGRPGPVGVRAAPVPRPWRPGDESDVVAVVAPFYQYRPILAESLAAQTCRAWRAWLIHDGPADPALLAGLPLDPRISLFETATRFNDWGHSLRQIGLNKVAKQSPRPAWIVVTNGDNYYAPGWLDAMLAGARSRPGCVAAYCDMVHNYWGWRHIPCVPEFGEIDCGALMVRADAALRVGWRSREHAADWVYCADLIGLYGHERFVHVDRALFVHN